MHTPQLVTAVVTPPSVVVVVVDPFKLVPSTVHFERDLASHKELGSWPVSPPFPSRERAEMLGGNEFGRVVTELDETRRVVTSGSEDARSEARAVREL